MIEQKTVDVRVSTHSRPKAAANYESSNDAYVIVSTHSRPKAAANAITQAPIHDAFQHTAARRRLRPTRGAPGPRPGVSTHSRPKAAASKFSVTWMRILVSTHSRPKAAAIAALLMRLTLTVSTHSRPKAAAFRRLPTLFCPPVSTHSRPKAAAGQRRAGAVHGARFNTQPPEGGCSSHHARMFPQDKFQHTAARRRLPFASRRGVHAATVSTHSRPKAAAIDARLLGLQAVVSTHSRPKAAARFVERLIQQRRFQHTAARRRLPAASLAGAPAIRSFNTQPPEGGCAH